MSLTPSTMTPLGSKAPFFDLISTEDTNVSLDQFNDKKVLVVMFICNHCPYVIHVKQGLIQLYNDYKDKGVGFVAISSNDPNYETSDSFENMKMEGYPFPYLFDETQEIAKSYSAACTPDIFVYNDQRTLVYRGQLDGSRPGNSIPVTGENLRSALDAVLNGSPVSQDQRPSTGCNIKWLPGNEPDYY